MDNIERIRRTISLQENKRELESKKAFIESELQKVREEEIINQDNSYHYHIAFRFGNKSILSSKGIVKCLICNKNLNYMDYHIAEDLTVNANIYSKVLGYNLCFGEALFNYFQNKFLELSEKNPYKDNREIVAMLNEMIKSYDPKELAQSLGEALQADEKPLGLKKVDTTTQQN